MMTNPKIRANTRYAFACIALMMLMFLVFVVLMAVPLGLSAGHQVTAVRVCLYALVLFAFLGGIFSIRVAILRKNSTKVVK